MKKLSVIFAVMFVLTIMSYGYNSQADDFHKETIDEIAKYLKENGVKDTDCPDESYECYKFLYQIESKEDNFVKMMEVKVRIKKEKKKKKKFFKKFKKKEKETKKDEKILIINAFYKEKKLKKIDDKETGMTTEEITVKLVDKDGDGTLDELNRVSKEDGKVFLKLVYKEGDLKGEGAKKELLKEWTPKDIQEYYEDYLGRVRELLNL